MVAWRRASIRLERGLEGASFTVGEMPYGGIMSAKLQEG
jgi:hypothetical protein